jgi:hypothetical protein
MHKILSIAIFLITADSFAQDLSEVKKVSAEPHLFWLSAGLGVGGGGIEGIGRLTYAWENSNISLQASASGPLAVGGGSGGIYLTEYGIYYGKHKLNPSSIFQGSAGLSYITTSEYGIKTKTIGLGFEGEGFLRANPFGLGLLFSVLISPKYTQIGITLNIHIGKLK